MNYKSEEEKATKSTEEEILVILLKKFYADKIQEFTEINERIDKTPTEIFNLLSEFLAEEAKLNEILTIATQCNKYKQATKLSSRK